MLRLGVVAVALLGVTACAGDPPGDGILYVLLRGENTGHADIIELDAHVSAVEVVWSKTADSDEETRTIPVDPIDISMVFTDEGSGAVNATFPVPPGFVHQVRLITEDVVMIGTDGSTPARVPSGTNTGVKLVPDAPVEIVKGSVTAIRSPFTIDDQFVFEGNGKVQFKPVIHSEETTPASLFPIHDHELVVHFDESLSRADIDAVIADVVPGATVLSVIRDSKNLLVISLPEDADMLKSGEDFTDNKNVVYAGPSVRAFAQTDNPRLPNSPDDPLFADQTYLTETRAVEAWDRQVGSMDVVVAVLDTGIRLDDPDIVPNLFLNEAEIPPTIFAQLQDADGDGHITFRDLNHDLNKDIVCDCNGNTFVDGDDVLQPVSAGGLADGLDGDPPPSGELEDTVIDDLVGAHFARVPGQEEIIHDGNVRDDNVQAARPQCSHPEFVGHGTATASIIGSATHNGVELAGVAWNVRILPIKVLDAEGGGDQIVIYTNAMRYARRMGADVASMSFGSTVDVDVNRTKEEFLLSIQTGAYADGLDTQPESMIMVLAAGNGIPDKDDECVFTGVDCLDRGIICGFVETIDPINTVVVGATDGTSGLAPFSERGPKVEINAPGVDLLLRNAHGGTQVASGTSFSAPQVAGALALAVAQNPDLRGDMVGLKGVVLGSATEDDEGNIFLDTRACVDAAAE